MHKTKQIISNEVCCQPNCNFMLATVETHFIISDALRFMFSRLISQQDKVAFCNSADILPTYPLTHHTYQHTQQSLCNSLLSIVERNLDLRHRLTQVPLEISKTYLFIRIPEISFVVTLSQSGHYPTKAVTKS